MTVSMDRSGTPGGRSATGRGRTWAMTWRRPSRPSVDQGTRLSWPAAHRAAGPAHVLPGPEDRRLVRGAGLDPPHRPSPHRGGRRPRAPPRQAAWPASRHSSGPPGSTAASRRPSQVASSCSAYAAPTSAPVVPPASPSDRIGDTDPTGSICSSCSPGPWTRRRSSRYASAEADRHGQREAGDPPARAEPGIRAGRAGPGPGEQGAAQPGHREPPAGLPEQAAQDRFARPRRQRPLQAEAERDGGEVGHQRQGPLPGQLLSRSPPSVPTASSARRLQRVLRPEREQVVQPGGQGGDEALVQGAAGREGRGERARSRGRGDQQPHVHPDVRRRRAGGVRPHRSS